MKKICFVAEYMLCGGTEKSLLSLLPYLDREKYEITLLLLKKKGDLMPLVPKDIFVDEIPLPEDEQDELFIGRIAAVKHAFKKGCVFSAVKKILRIALISITSTSGTARRLRYYKSIARKIKEYPREFDVVIDYMGYGLFNTFYAAYKVRGKTKISWVHFEPESAMPDFGVFLDVLKKYKHIMCVSNSSKEQMELMMPEIKEGYKVFYNIVDKKDILQKAKEGSIKTEDGGILVTSVGRLVSQKGFDIGVRVIQRLCKEGYPIKWLVIGEGSQRAQLESMIMDDYHSQNSIKLLGLRTNPYAFIDKSDIYFQPSRHEGYGIAIAEARALNKPIVAADFAGAREQLVHGETGLIAKCTEQDLYLALKCLIDDDQLRKKLSDNLKKQASEYPMQIKELEEIFDLA